MILTCPSCTTKFKLNADILGDVGRTVRCGECRFEWFQPPEREEITYDTMVSEEDRRDFASMVQEEIVVTPAITLKNPDSSPPDKKIDKISPIAASVMFVLLISALFIFKSSITSAWPHSRAFYALFLGDEGSNLSKQDVAFEHFTVTQNNGELHIEGKILNLLSEDIILPPLKVSLKTKDGIETETHIVTITPNILSGEETFTIDSSIKPIGAADMVYIRFAHLFEILEHAKESQHEKAHSEVKQAVSIEEPKHEAAPAHH